MGGHVVRETAITTRRLACSGSHCGCWRQDLVVVREWDDDFVNKRSITTWGDLRQRVAVEMGVEAERLALYNSDACAHLATGAQSYGREVHYADHRPHVHGVLLAQERPRAPE